MTINSKFKSLLAIVLLSGMSSFAAQSAEENDNIWRLGVFSGH